MQNFPLPLGQVMGHSVRGDIAARQETHPDAAGLFAEFRFRVSGLDTQFHNLLGAASPSFNHTAQIKNLGNDWIARSGWMVSFQIFGFKIEGKGTIAPDLKPIIIDGQTYRTTDNGIIPVTKGVYQGFAQGLKGEQWFILTLEKAGDNSSSYGQVAAKEQHGLLKQMESMAFKLPLIEKLRFTHASEAGKAQLALRIIWHEAGTKQDDRSLIGTAVPEQSQTPQNIRNKFSG